MITMVVISAKAAAPLIAASRGRTMEVKRREKGAVDGRKRGKKAHAPAAEDAQCCRAARAVCKIWVARSLLWTAWTKRLLLYL